MGRIVFLGDRETSVGFKLAGVAECYAAKGAEAEKKLEELIADEDVSVVIANERVMTELDWKLKKKIETLAKPALVLVPDKAGPVSEIESLKEMVKRALGFELIK